MQMKKTLTFISISLGIPIGFSGMDNKTKFKQVLGIRVFHKFLNIQSGITAVPGSHSALKYFHFGDLKAANALVFPKLTSNISKLAITNTY